MTVSEIYYKTAKGQSEVETKTDALSMKDRRVLILVNGENNTATLKRLSLCEDIVEILKTLLDGGFIEQDDATLTQTDFDPGAEVTEMTEVTETVHEVSAREFMCNTLLTFANRVRVARLIEDINTVEDIEALTNLIKPWYHAISETPGGMYQADDLRQELQNIIANEEIAGMR